MATKEMQKQIKRFEKFVIDYKSWSVETAEDAADLYEDANTRYSLTDIKVYKTMVKFTTEYKGWGEHSYEEVSRDEEDLAEWIDKFRADLRRAKRYWSMDCEKLDRIQNGDAEDDDE